MFVFCVLYCSCLNFQTELFQETREILFRLNLEVTNNELYYLLLPIFITLKQNNIQIIQSFFLKLHVCVLTINCFSLMYLLFLDNLGVWVSFFPCYNYSLLDCCKVFPEMHLICCFLRMLISDLLECSSQYCLKCLEKLDVFSQTIKISEEAV